MNPIRRLTKDELRKALALLPDWSSRPRREGRTLTREFDLKTAKAAYAFQSTTTCLAAVYDHGPVVTGFGSVVVVCLVNARAQGLTVRELAFAAALSSLERCFRCASFAGDLTAVMGELASITPAQAEPRADSGASGRNLDETSAQGVKPRSKTSPRRPR